MVAERIKKLRERIQRREKSTRASRRAKSRRIKKGKPKGATETAQVKARQARESAEMTAEEARKLASDAKQLISTEVGVSSSESESVISQGAALIGEAGDSLSELDFDGDGDTDILSGVDPIEPQRNDQRSGPDMGLGGGGGRSDDDPDMGLGGGNGDGGTDPTEPVYDPFDDDELDMGL